MSTITKLNYLADTKDEIKDALNSKFNAGITDNDTFRSYVDKIKGIYNNWPKVTNEGTEITLTPTRKGRMQLDLKGNTSQDSTTGKNLLDVEIENSKYLAKSLKKLARLQRQLARKTRGSNRWNKARIKVAKCHEHIANQRADFLHKLSTRFIREYDVISLEDLNVSGILKNHKLARSVSDVSWSQFVTMLQYKADWYGKEIVKIDRFFASSQLCSVCGYKNTETKDLSVRSWVCPNCGTSHDRDVNASINILNEGLKQIV